MYTSTADFDPRLSTPASIPASSRNDAHTTSIPANTYLFQRDGLAPHTAGIYLQAVLDVCRSSGQDLTQQSAVTRLVYHKKEGMPFHEYLTAHVVYIVDGVLRPEFSAEVDFHRFVDKDSGHIHSKPHLLALLRVVPLVGVDHHALKHHALDTSRPFRDIVRLPFISSSACSTFGAHDTIEIRPMGAQAVMNFLEPGRFPFSLERLASLVDFATHHVAPVYNPVGQNCYHMSSWVWNAVLQLAEGPVHHSDLNAMGKFGKFRLLHGKRVTGPFLLSDASVTEAHLEGARKRWNDYRRSTSETLRRMESKKRAMEKQLAMALEEARLANEREMKMKVLLNQRPTKSLQSRRQSLHGV
ncbi:hypothetical protein CPB85DRAFT_1342548 [Mucidula mucida]|nr:hypothetical protein CPB85DRAFT_1342548 [Mucidula mucida]